jgi:E3 ubiquitin-protein ligase SIAH1
MEDMVPPISMCANGHNICHICRKKMNQCPSCRQQFLETRNLALEELASHVKYPCKYQSYGCKEVFANDVIVSHQDRCWYCPQSCPVPGLNTEKCSWTGNYDQIKNHLKEKHRDKCYDYGEEEPRAVKKFHTIDFYFKFIFAFDEVFFQRFLRKGDIFYVSVFYVGHTENAAKYKYKVKFVNADNTKGFSVKNLTRRFDKEGNVLLTSGDCGKLLYDEMSHLTNEEGDLSYKVKILRIGD